MRSGRSKTRGHTLIEALLTLAIVALLAAVGLQSWQQLMRSQRRAEGRTALLAVLQQQERHFSRYGRYQPFDAAAPGGFKWHSGPTPADSAYGLSAVACAGETVARCIMAVARPGSAGATSGFADPVCGALAVDSRGRQQADGGVASCW